MMKSIESWLDEYGESHTNPINKRIHWLAVPVIYITVLGLLWDVPRPDLFSSPWLNWATLLAVPAMIFYFMLSVAVGMAMTLFTIVVAVLINWFDQQQIMAVSLLSLILFVIMWVFQFVGHYIEGQKPSFFKDIQFLLIGPAWLMAFVLRWLKINY
jgi:uncharacterized membrane protein YGL010W